MSQRFRNALEEGRGVSRFFVVIVEEGEEMLEKSDAGLQRAAVGTREVERRHGGLGEGRRAGEHGLWAQKEVRYL